MKIILKNKGFTLIETIVAIFVFAMALGLITTFIFSVYRTNDYTVNQTKAINEARRGVDAMIRDLRGAVTAANGFYPIERADDKQIIFYSDVDDDGQIERVRYFLGTINSGSGVKECTTSANGGGSCSVTFLDFLTGSLKSAQVRASAMGDLDQTNEYVAVKADSTTLGNLCQIFNECSHCSVNWAGDRVFDVTSQATDGLITFFAQATDPVRRECSPSYSMKARFELSWSEEIVGAGNELKLGITKPVGDPAEYPTDQEVISLVTPYVRNDPPIFKYYGSDGAEITDPLDRLNDTKLIKIDLMINVDENRPPDDFQLESFVQVRNLKEE